MIIERKENVYVQPECKVFQVQLQRMIATSGVSTQSDNDPDDFSYGGTL